MELYVALEQYCIRLRKPGSTVLFKRGERAFGMFVVLEGTIVLDFGVDAAAPPKSVCGSGALLGISATLAKSNYSMTATVVNDAALGFLPTEGLFALLRRHPETGGELLRIVKGNTAHVHKVQRGVPHRDELPARHGCIH